MTVFRGEALYAAASVIMEEKLDVNVNKRKKERIRLGPEELQAYDCVNVVAKLLLLHHRIE